jgi:thiosulfate/3-mercaptopyruvate sulfurtransferase
VSGERVLSTVEELAEALAREPPALLDVRWALGDPLGHEHYLAGHVPGAVFADLDRELSAPASAAGGRHPLPDLGSLEATARRWGVRRGAAAVVYDDNAGMSAARAWWLLRWAGVGDVTILDGGLAAWTASGRALQTGETVAAQVGDIVLRAGAVTVLDVDGAAALARDGLLLDARAGERYRGEVEPIDARAGHIPGAISAPTSENVDPDGRFRDAARLRSRFEALGASPGAAIGVYCGSGVSAAHEIAALALAGFDAALFPGSWSAWSADPAREAATGAEPG